MQHRVAPFLASMMLTCAAATSAAAQQNPVGNDRSAASSAAAQPSPVARYWYALESAQAPEQLSTITPPSELDDVLAGHLRALREYELAPRKRSAIQLRWDLSRELERQRSSAEHHMAMALLLRRGPDAVVRLDDKEANSFIDPRSNASFQALRSLRHVLRADPTHELAAVELARFVLERHEKTLLPEAEAALAQVEQSSEVLLQRAAVALERADLTAALAHTLAAKSAGADPGRVAHLRAIALLLDPATERMGAAVYLDGLERASTAAVHDYHSKSAITFTLQQEAVWDSLPAGERAGWLRELWEMRALRNGVSIAERLGVHYRRLYEAYRDWPLYNPLVDARNMAGMGVFIGEDPRRHGVAPPGVALVRFGDPAWFRWLAICGTEVMYLYQDPNSPFRVMDLFLPPKGYLAADTMDVLQHEDSRRMREVDCGNPTAVRQYAQWMISGERYRPGYEKQLAVQTEVYAFKAAEGAEIVAGITLETAELQELRGTDGRITLNAAIALIDSIARRSSRAERQLQFAAPDRATERVLLSASARSAVSGDVELRITVEDAARRRGAVVGFARNIPDFSQPGVLLSDVVIGPQRDAPVLRRGEVETHIAAGRKYRRGETFDLYYEVYGLDKDAPYSTRIVVAPHSSALWRGLQRLTGTEPDVIALQFEDNAGTPHAMYGVQEMRSVGTSSLSAGTYRLRVEVTDMRSGKTSSRERLLEITR